MGRETWFFVAGLLIGALPGRVTALFSRMQLGERNSANGQSRTEGLTAKVLDRDREELGSWSGQVTASKQVSELALSGAPLGWY